MLTRRAAMIIGLGGAAGAPGFSKDFWVEKKPDQWSEKETEKLLSHSPWSKEVTAEMNMGGMGGMGGGRGAGGMSAESAAGMGGGEMGGPGGGGGGGRGGRGGGGGMGEMPQRPEIKAQVRWESAAAVRAALKRPIPKELANHYVISLNTQPNPMMMGGGGPPRGERGGERPEGAPPDPEARRKAMVERMKTSTELRRKGKDPIHPEQVLTGQDQNRLVFLFLFSRQGQSIELDDKDVTFVTKMGPAEFKTKFSLKDMVFDGKLEL